MGTETIDSESLRLAIEWMEIAISLTAVAAIVGGFVFASVRFAAQRWRASDSNVGGDRGYARFRGELAQALMISLEILVIADVIRTILLEPSYRSLAALGLLVIVRTFMSWTLTLEIEHRWPWQRRGEEPPHAG